MLKNCFLILAMLGFLIMYVILKDYLMGIRDMQEVVDVKNVLKGID